MPSVKDIMTKKVFTVEADKTVVETAELMNAKSVGCLVIVDKEAPVGMVTERDIVRRVVAQKRSPDLKVSEIMTTKLVTVDPDMSLKEAARIMSKNKIRRLPVTKDKRLVGIVVASDFVRNMGKKTFSEEVLEALGRYPPDMTSFNGMML
jgi:CBS domain-containing protein